LIVISRHEIDPCTTMKKVLDLRFLPLFLLLFLAAIAAPSDGTSPQDVITRLLANASKKPPGPVESDVTDQTVSTAKAMAKGLPDALPPHEGIAAGFKTFSLEGPLTSLYSEGPAALFYGKAKLTKDALADLKEDSIADNPPGFGDAGGFSDFIGPKVRPDGRVIATFCLVQQHGFWKVHGVYLSNEIIAGSDKTFIVNQLAAFAKK
jgi:hypothetical protein